jgi:hypothetical protein
MCDASHRSNIALQCSKDKRFFSWTWQPCAQSGGLPADADYPMYFNEYLLFLKHSLLRSLIRADKAWIAYCDATNWRGQPMAA